jgi:tetratricopeptide (TPR) repeat protein
VELDDRHGHAHLIRGNLLLQDPKQSKESIENACISFKKAYSLDKTLSVFNGLIRSLISTQRIKEAWAFAKEANRIFPSNALALAILGGVLCQPNVPGIRAKAREHFEQALKLDPTCVEAVLGFSQLNIAEGKLKEALEMYLADLKLTEFRLMDCVKSVPKDFIHVRIADVHMLMNNFNSAVEHLNQALTINPHCETAKVGLQRLDKLMKGDKEEPQEEEGAAEDEVDEEEQVEESDEMVTQD